MGRRTLEHPENQDCFGTEVGVCLEMPKMGHIQARKSKYCRKLLEPRTTSCVDCNADGGEGVGEDWYPEKSRTSIEKNLHLRLMIVVL
jgi:hypothetical protein